MAIPLLLNTQCRWPLGDPLQSDFRWCALSRLEGYSYCEQHRRIAYVKTPALEMPPSDVA